MSTQKRKNDPLNPPATLQVGRAGERLEYVGPSLRGYVYREASGSRYFRLLPIDDVLSLTQRSEIDGWIGKPQRQGLAQIVETGDVTVQGSLFFYVAYETSGRSMLELLSEADPRNRLFLMSKVAGSLPVWWETNGEVNYPMPADIVFKDQWPVLLALPSLGYWPRFETLLAEPSRIPFLAPELIRGNRKMIRDRNLDIYVCGVMMMQCLFSWSATEDPFLLIQKGASSTLFEPEGLTKRMPIWIDRVDLYPEVVHMVRTALDPDPRIRADADPAQAAVKLRDLADRLDPRAVVEDLRAKKRFQKAIDFIGDVCLGESRFDLLLLAGRIAKEDLQDAVAGLEWLERAVQSAPAGNIESHRLQLAILLNWTGPDHTDAPSKIQMDSPAKMIAMAWRDYHALPTTDRDRLFMEVTSYFIKKGQFVNAQQVLHPYLYYSSSASGDPSRGQPTFMWWEFPRTLLYSEALIGEIPESPGKFEAARAFLDGIKNALSTVARYPVTDPRRVEPAVIERFGSRILQLEKMLTDCRR